MQFPRPNRQLLASLAGRGPAWHEPKHDTYLLGLDLGQAADYSALAVAQQTDGEDPERPDRDRREYAVRHLQRWPLQTSYLDIVADVEKLALQLPGAVDGLPGSEPVPKPILLIDGTGVGRAVVDLFRKARLPCHLIAVTITAGDKVNAARGGYCVPKKELVSAMQTVMQARRFKVASGLKEAAILTREMQTFKVKVNIATGNESFEAHRSRAHDDLVLATAIPVWYGERGAGFWIR